MSKADAIKKTADILFEWIAGIRKKFEKDKRKLENASDADLEYIQGQLDLCKELMEKASSLIHKKIGGE